MTDGSEPEAHHLDRNWLELLQELRVAQTGIQILTGFLLTLPFTPRFDELAPESKVVYACVLGAAVVATFLLMTPVALHRALFREGERPWLVRKADLVAQLGLGALALANMGALWLVLDFISSRWLAHGAAVTLAAGVLWLWVLLPRTHSER